MQLGAYFGPWDSSPSKPRFGSKSLLNFFRKASSQAKVSHHFIEKKLNRSWYIYIIIYKTFIPPFFGSGFFVIHPSRWGGAYQLQVGGPFHSISQGSVRGPPCQRLRISDRAQASPDSGWRQWVPRGSADTPTGTRERRGFVEKPWTSWWLSFWKGFKGREFSY